MLLERRETFKPFEYPELQSMWEKIQKTYWIHNSIDFSTDVQHFRIDLTEDERYIVGTILKSFTQAELVVMDDFWSLVGKFFPKPEVQILGVTFAENEARHSVAYSRLNDVLGIHNFDEFLKDPVLIERFNNLKIGDDEVITPKKIMLVLSVFGCYTEYVNLFSQFAILKSFSANGRNLLPNIGNIIEYSALDEQTHALTAMYLLNKLKSEYPEHWTDDVIKTIRDYGSTTFEIESKLIAQIFERGNLPNLTKAQLINFMKNRINEALTIINVPILFTDVDANLLSEMDWFLTNIFAKQHTDFFYRKPTAYSKFTGVYDKNSVFVSRDEILNVNKS